MIIAAVMKLNKESQAINENEHKSASICAKDYRRRELTRREDDGPNHSGLVLSESRLEVLGLLLVDSLNGVSEVSTGILLDGIPVLIFKIPGDGVVVVLRVYFLLLVHREVVVRVVKG
jgi:hypothetical protein